MADSPHLLHIDHHAEDRDLVARMFRECGAPGTLHGLGSAADALLFLNRLPPYAQAPRPRLVVLELALPRFDGLQLLRILRETPRFRTLPVVVFCAPECYASLDHCRAYGVEECFVKPRSAFEWREVVASFGHWLMGSSSGFSCVPPRATP